MIKHSLLGQLILMLVFSVCVTDTEKRHIRKGNDIQVTSCYSVNQPLSWGSHLIDFKRTALWMEKKKREN